MQKMLICSGDMVYRKTLQFDWLRTFYSKSLVQNLSQICAGTQQIIFVIEQIQ